MKPRYFAVPAALALILPVCAHAQIAGDERPGVVVSAGIYGPVDPQAVAIHAQTAETRQDVRHAVDAGQMSKREGRQFKRESRRIDARTSRASSTGPMSYSAARELGIASRALDSLANAPAARASRQERDKDRNGED